MLREYFDKYLTTYCVEFTEKTNNYNYIGKWYCEYVIADYAEQAIEILKDKIAEQGDNPDKYIYTIKGIESVNLFWTNDVVRFYTKQDPIFDENTGLYLFKTEDGRWIAQDDAIGEWLQIRR